MIKNIDTTFNKGALDNWLDQLTERPNLWPDHTEEKISRVVQEIAALKKTKHKVAGTSGGLAAAGSLLSCAPFGGAIAAPFTFAANYYGTSKGVDIGIKYAKESDLKQDLFRDTEQFYLSLAVRLLDRYLKTRQLHFADKIEKGSNTQGLLDGEKKERLAFKAQKIAVLADNILKVIDNVEDNATELLIGKPPAEQPKKGFLKKRPDTKKIEKRAGLEERTKTYIRSITSPLREVCEAIKSNRSKIFSEPSLRNEKETMKLRLKRRLEKRAYQLREQANQEVIAKLVTRVDKLEAQKGFIL